MSTPVAALDLRSPAPPRSVSAWSISTSYPFSDGSNTGVIGGGGNGIAKSTNPFDDASSASGLQQKQRKQQHQGGGGGSVYAVAYGTERGSLHFRTYPPIGRDGTPGELKNSGGGGTGSSGGGGFGSERVASTFSVSSVGVGGGAGGGMVQPLGAHGGKRVSVHLQPVDLNGAVPGVVMGLVRVTSTAIPTFLVLVDDNRGVGNTSSLSSSSSHSLAGAYAAHVVSLRHNAFAKIGGSASTLPRMSAVAYHPTCGFVYAGGTAVYSLSTSIMSAVLTDGEGLPYPSHQQQQQQRRSAPHHLRHQQQQLYAEDESNMPLPIVKFASTVLPTKARSGHLSLALSCGGRVAIVATNDAAFYAVSSVPVQSIGTIGAGGAIPRPSKGGNTVSADGGTGPKKVISFSQSSQVHPAIVINVCASDDDDTVSASAAAVASMGGDFSRSGRGQGQLLGGQSRRRARSRRKTQLDTTSVLFLALGRECAVVKMTYHDVRHQGTSSSSNTPSSMVMCGSPRHGVATLASPILAACSVGVSGAGRGGGRRGRRVVSTGGILNHHRQPLVAFLTSDGLVHTRSPSCVAIPLTTVEVGNRPKNFFSLSSLPKRRLLAVAYSGDARVIVCRSDTSQDLADRMMKLSIDAFGAHGFPRAELAEAIHASFSATSYVGPEPSNRTRNLLRQYLEAMLGLSDEVREKGATASGGKISKATVRDDDGSNYGDYDYDDDDDDNDESSAYDEEYYEDDEYDEDEEDEAEIIPRGAFDGDDVDERMRRATSAVVSPTSLTAVALLCLVCPQLVPANGGLANRAAKTYAIRMSGSFSASAGAATGVGSRVNPAVIKVCDAVADQLLKEAASFSLLATSQPVSSSARVSATNSSMDFVEASLWLFRMCGRHERAINVLQDKMSSSSSRGRNDGGGSAAAWDGGWSLLKYESYTASHLGELWSSRDFGLCNLVLRSLATKRLLEQSPEFGLSIFTASHPQNTREWKAMVAHEDPLYHPVDPRKVVALLKSIMPSLKYGDKGHSSSGQSVEESVEVEYNKFLEGAAADAAEGGASAESEKSLSHLPLKSGRALAVTFLESAVGMSTGRPSVEAAFDRLPPDAELEERAVAIHDELAYLLLEGVISERGGGGGTVFGGSSTSSSSNASQGRGRPAAGQDDSDQDSELGLVYRRKLRKFLGWKNSKCRAERILASLPSSFLREHALLLGRLGRHEDALRILYCDLQSLDLALEYCDSRHSEKKTTWNKENTVASGRQDGFTAGCAYLPLVRVALESDPNSERGISAAIQVLAARRDDIDRGAALRLLPQDIPVSAVARPFLIPALVDSESQVRRLNVAASLLRARYVELKRALTDAQIRSQAILATVPALRSLNLGNEPLRSSRAFRARPAHAGVAPAGFPDVFITKHIYKRHLVLQAQITNSSPVGGEAGGGGLATTAVRSGNVHRRTLGDVAFIVAESSDDSAIVPGVRVVPIKTLPPGITGSAWSVLAVSPSRFDETIFLTCELRYTVLAVDAATGAPLSFSGGGGSTGGTASALLTGDSAAGDGGRSFVEELQDIEIRPTEFVV